MGLTGQEERACVHDSMRMGWGRGGAFDSEKAASDKAESKTHVTAKAVY
jgi:hypothetical protein